MLRVSYTGASCAGHMLLLVDIICFSPQTSSYGNITPSAVFRMIFRSWQIGQIVSSLLKHRRAVRWKKKLKLLKNRKSPSLFERHQLVIKHLVAHLQTWLQVYPICFGTYMSYTIQFCSSSDGAWQFLLVSAQ